MNDSDQRIIIFCKQPYPGQVKTRLAQQIGDVEAANLALAMARRTIRACIDADVAKVDVWQTPDLDDIFVVPGVAGVHLQCDGDLGQRMAYAIAESLKESAAVVLLGTDCPGIDAGYATRAFDDLAHLDVVIGPAEDGGFGLIGMTRSADAVALFNQITWSTPGVYQAVCERLARANCRWGRLALLWDIDRPFDLARYQVSYDQISQD